MYALPPLPRPPRTLQNVLLGLSLLGLSLAVRLALIGRETSAGICKIGQNISCEIVAESDASVLFGVPLAAWGALAYAIAGTLALASRGDAARPGIAAGLLVVVSASMSAVAVYLAYVSAARLHVLCPLCATSWFVSFALFLTSMRLARRAGGVVPAIRSAVVQVTALARETLGIDDGRK